MKKFTAFLLAMILLLAIPLTATASDYTSGSANHFNVMLVVDATGSLSGHRGSDPTGLRYDSLRLFLGMLTNTGNYAGAVVFDDDVMLNEPPKLMQSMADKVRLAKKIEDARIGSGRTTNIVVALDKAVDDLTGMTAQTGYPSIILLLTDGNDNTLKTNESAQMKQRVIDKAVAEGISINGILLNKGNAGNPEEIEEYAMCTGGWSTPVSSAEDLAEAFRQFYMAINNVRYNGEDRTIIDETGIAEKTFAVPTFGVEEVNIVLDLSQPLDSITLTSPDGVVYTKRDVDNMSMITSRYQLIKISEPEHGLWTVTLKGQPGSSIDVKMLFNCSYNCELTSDNNREVYLHEVPYTFTCIVKDEKHPNISIQDYNTLNAILCIEDKLTRETVEVPMEPTENGYKAQYSFKVGGYYAYAVIGLGDFFKKSEELDINVENKAPECKGTDYIEETIKTGLFQKGIYTLDLNTVFVDPEGGKLEYTINDHLGKNLTRDGDIITVDCLGIKYSNFNVTATDVLGAEAVLKVSLTEKNMTGKIIAVFAGILAVIGIVIALLAVRRANLKCNLEIAMQTFDVENDDWNNLEPVFSLRGKKPLNKYGEVFGARARDYWIEATSQKDVCLFRGKKPFYYGAGKTKKAEIRPGQAKIYFDPALNYGIEIEAELPGDMW